MLRRLGKKTKIAQEIIKYFPPHRVYIEMFFGAGGLYFAKPKATVNILNDLDNEVFNFYQVVINKREEFEHELKHLILHQSLFKYWKTHNEVNPVKQALRYWYLSGMGYLGNPNNMKIVAHQNNFIKLAIDKLQYTFEKLQNVQFINQDFRNVLNVISWKSEKEIRDTFIYADPPYLGTTDNYSNFFKIDDTKELFDILTASGMRFAVSEFDNPKVLEIAAAHNLNVIKIKERLTLKNRNTEILITNYKTQNSLF